jgi:hypothetical protein
MGRTTRLMINGLAVLTAQIVVAAAQAAPCPIQKASAQIPFRDSVKQSALPGNVGIVPGGFVAPEGVGPVVHGIDVSKWQDTVNFMRAYECGARFAYIRLSTGTDPDKELAYRDFWANARSYGLLVGGYHNLAVADSRSNYLSMSAAEQGYFWKKTRRTRSPRRSCSLGA